MDFLIEPCRGRIRNRTENLSAGISGLGSEACVNLAEDEGEDAQYFRDLISHYLVGIGGITVSCLGTLGNIVSLFILTNRSFQSSTYTYLSALALSDTVFLFCVLLLATKDLRPPAFGEAAGKWDPTEFYPYIFRYVQPMAFILHVVSIWLTLAFTVDRYIAICQPFQAVAFCTISRARRVVVSLFLISTLFNLPKFFEYQTVFVRHPTSGTLRVTFELTWIGRSRLFRQLYHSFFYLVFVIVLPLVLLIVLNAFLVHDVRMSARGRQKTSAPLRSRNDTTFMLIGTIFVFFVCQTPALVSHIVWAFAEDPTAFKNLGLYTLKEVGNFLVTFNSAINVVPYYLFGQRFRRRLFRLFRNCFPYRSARRNARRLLPMEASDSRYKTDGIIIQTVSLRKIGKRRIRISQSRIERFLRSSFADRTLIR